MDTQLKVRFSVDTEAEPELLALVPNAAWGMLCSVLENLVSRYAPFSETLSRYVEIEVSDENGESVSFQTPFAALRHMIRRDLVPSNVRLSADIFDTLTQVLDPNQTKESKEALAHKVIALRQLTLAA